MRPPQNSEVSRGFQFASLDALFEGLGVTKPVRRILVANNSLAAVKGIDSIRAWLYEHIGQAEAMQLVVMATPEDLKANMEFISMADQHTVVPGGPASNNYANVDLIMHTALQNMCDAIYPGWGHASENPALPRECQRSKRVTFLGPAEDAMFALGDKIASTIVAQSNGVPVVPWSGESIRLPPGVFEVDAGTYEKAYVNSPEECEEVCRRIGFPVMIKASEGGGGKGIRCCTSEAQVRDLYFAVSEEVKGCHIFVMRMLTNVRHLEVQLLADNYGNCIAVRTRDCSVQRRHQKIIEEGPAVDVDPQTIRDMENAAIALAKAVNYRGLGTVEYMYDKGTKKFYFLELNPRIQVEHPVSEMITGVNLPAALVCVGMGVRLDRIPEVRSFYDESPYETTPIDFTTRDSIPSRCHSIAVRITAEDTDEGFRPTSGKVEEIAFKNSKECWGYFSVGSGGEIHNYADSQFGHIFSSGDTREEARRGMVRALRNLVVRGEIRTSSSYVAELLETEAFTNCDVSTSWLDTLIAHKADEEPSRHSVHVPLAAASIFRNIHSVEENREKYLSFLTAGHVPSTDYLVNYETESYVSHNVKYNVTIGKASPNEYAIGLNGSILTVPYRLLKSGALQLTIGGRTAVAYVEREPNSLRITIGGKVTTFSGDTDPTKIQSSVPGRLVRYVIANGGHVNEGGTFAEVEVMKMVLPLRCSTAGVLHHRAVPGSTIVMGTLLAEVVPDDPSKVSRPRVEAEPWPAEMTSARQFQRPDGITRAHRGAMVLWNLLSGYHFKDASLDERLRRAFDDLSSIFLSSVTLPALQLPFLAAEEALAAQTPTEKLTAIFDAMIRQYMEVERYFDKDSRQESISLLRATFEDDNAAVYAIDFAHAQECHHSVIKAVLAYAEQNTVLLKAMKPSLTTLVTLQSYLYGSLLLQTRYLLRQSALPSFVERKTALAQELDNGVNKELIEGSYGYDLMCAVMFDPEFERLIQVCLELFARREYYGDGDVQQLETFKMDGSWYCTFVHAASEETRPINLAVTDDDVVAVRSGAGACVTYPDVQTLRRQLATSMTELKAHTYSEFTTVTIFVACTRETNQEEVAVLCARILEDHKASILEHQRLESVTFMVHGLADGPFTFTYGRGLGFREDPMIRNILPQSARRLELGRLSNFEVSMYPTPYKDVHLFRGTPKKGTGNPLENRFFARVALTPHEMGMAPWTEGTDVDAGHMLAKCMAALEVAQNDPTVKYPPSNHIFVKMIQLTFDVSSLQRLLAAAASSYQQRLISLGVSEVELSFQVRVSSGLIPMRVVVSSPSGYGINIRVYYEMIENGVVCLHKAETSEDVILSAMGASSEALVDFDAASPLMHSPSDCDQSSSALFGSAGAKPGSPFGAQRHQRSMSKLEDLKDLLPSKKRGTAPVTFQEEEDEASLPSRAAPLGPYPHLSRTQVKRLQARGAKCTYVHDWPSLLSLILRKDWGVLRQQHKFDRRCVPSRVLKAVQLFLCPDGATLCAVDDGRSPSGMVVWVVEYYPPALFNLETKEAASRRIVVAANDITFQSGSFAVPEDVMFKAACEHARAQRLPFVYLSANSGARLGLCAEAKKRFLVAMTEAGEMDYLYFTEADYAALRERNVEVAVEERVVGGEKRFVIHGVVGSPSEYLGVENLRGSGLVAGEMSKNFSEIPTISVVSGRSVGIGAYLNRLGRRVIQTADSPLILTGAAALNRLLGKEVYADNSQLGGRQIMVPNGVTHWNPKHEYASARTLLRWLDFVPTVTHPRRCRPQVLTLPAPDPVDRDVTFAPERDVPYDPRALVAGTMDRAGLFDKGSWMESLEGWAKTVVTGRATLGGIPCGVIVVETRLTKKFDPADPADPTSASSFVTQAGQVWFPDSARKTADALEDFHHERLPCFILANWRGFSGGMRDMFDEVLKFGASIVDNLRVYSAPVFIYIPPWGELRGGAWVVVDPVINHNGVVEMYCDPTSRGGILEPSGVVEIKFRDNDVRELIRRNHPELATMEPKTAREEEARLLPRYRDVAVRFADLHDTHVRMRATGVVRDVIPWVDSRRVFHAKLQRKLKELDIANDLVESGQAPSLAAAAELIQRRYHEHQQQQNGGGGAGPAAWGTDDVAQREWLEQTEAEGLWRRGSEEAAARRAQLKALLATCADKEELKHALEEVFADEAVARVAMEALRSCDRSVEDIPPL